MTVVNTIGIVRVCCCIIRDVSVPCDRMTSDSAHHVRRCGFGTGVVAAGDAQYELQIAAFIPSERRKPLRESGEIALRHRVALQETHEHPTRRILAC